MTMVEPGGRIAVSLTVNGTPVAAEVEVRRTLADFLRDDLGLTGTHLGCEHGVCGACTIELDGRAVRSCLLLTVQADGSAITTIEGLAAADGSLSLLQEAFRQAHGFQCAFCAPGFLLTTKVLLEHNPHPTRDQIREELSGNLCRCTGYHSILDSVETAVRQLRSATADTSEVTAP
jgi:carbon-monoxide dehydrogenase small subunit